MGSIMEIVQKSKEILIQKKKPYSLWYSGKEAYLDDIGLLPLIRFTACQEYEWMDLAFSTRLGGISTGHLGSLNLGWDRGDTRETVCENYRRVCKALGTDYRKLVLSDQVHDTKIIYADEHCCGGEEIAKKQKGIDGLITDIPGLVLATSYADCVPLFFIDPVKRRIASSHSGWKGTVARMGMKTVKKMEEQGSQPKDVIVIIGPSICQDCYEVSEDVAMQFRKEYGQTDCVDILAEGRVTEEEEQKYQLDLWAANWHQLAAAGILPEHIHISGVCTCCNQELLYSHRASHGKRGNLNGFMFIREGDK